MRKMRKGWYKKAKKKWLQERLYSYSIRMFDSHLASSVTYDPNTNCKELRIAYIVCGGKEERQLMSRIYESDECFWLARRLKFGKYPDLDIRYDKVIEL